MIQEKEYTITISIHEMKEMLDKIARYQNSLDKILRYTHFEYHGLEFIREEVLYTLDK